MAIVQFNKRFIWALGVVGALSFTVSSPREASAEKCGSENIGNESGEVAKSGQQFRTVTRPNGQKVIIVEKDFVVCTSTPKPNVLYVLQATAINYEWENLKQDFLPLIDSSVKKWPF